jgi:hypothetical protein
VRIADDPPLLCVGAQFEICASDCVDCFGVVTACHRASVADETGDRARFHYANIEVSRCWVYFPCSPKHVDGFLSEVVLVMADKSVELRTEIERRRKLAFTFNDEHTQGVARTTMLTKKRLIDDKDSAVQLTLDELGAVWLRNGFLVSQPLLSACVRTLIVQWYPLTHDDECTRAFGSKDGPWDVFYLFDYLRKRNVRSNRGSSNSFEFLCRSLGYLEIDDPIYNDMQQRLLEANMDRYNCCQCGVLRTNALQV